MIYYLYKLLGKCAKATSALVDLTSSNRLMRQEYEIFTFSNSLHVFYRICVTFSKTIIQQQMTQKQIFLPLRTEYKSVLYIVLISPMLQCYKALFGRISHFSVLRVRFSQFIYIIRYETEIRSQYRTLFSNAFRPRTTGFRTSKRP